jgi:general secretion pathway protein M
MNFWSNLNRREKIVTGGGGILLLAVLLYLVVISPLRGHLAEMRESLAGKNADLAWMHSAAQKIGQLKNAAPARHQTSPLKLIDINAKKHGINNKLKRIDPGESNRIKVWFEGLPFVDLVAFLREIDQKQGIGVVSLTAEKLDDPGLVNARVTFRTGR